MPPQWLDTELEDLYKAHSSVLYAWLLQKTGSDEMAADILQDTFLGYYRTRQKRDKPVNIRAYLFMIARNNHLKMLRSKRENHELMPVDELAATDDTEEMHLQEDARQTVAHAINHDLTGLEKEVMGYRFDQGFTTPEIAHIVKKSERTVRRTLRSAADELKKVLEKRGWDLADL